MKIFIERKDFIQRIQETFESNPVCALLGPRQCGKSTLAKLYAEQVKEQVHLLDLENPAHLARLENAQLTLETMEGLIIIDEIQFRPELFPLLRVLVDSRNQNYLILGSASPTLIRQTSETLAGRISYIEMTPFSLPEVQNMQLLWQRGGFPKSFLAANDRVSRNWRRDFIKTFLEKDIPQLGFDVSLQLIRRFWLMLTHYHGGIFNASEIGGSLNVSYKTIGRYLDILEGTYMMRRLSPWFENLKKRQIKSPKVYFRDSGLFHSLLGIEDQEGLFNHPKIGISFEGFAIEEVIRFHKAEAEDCYFWGTQSGAELDLMVVQNGKKLGFEMKYTDYPKLTKSMQIALDDLKLDKLTVIVPKSERFLLADQIEVCGLENYVG
jgi:hypothetical protein